MRETQFLHKKHFIVNKTTFQLLHRHLQWLHIYKPLLISLCTCMTAEDDDAVIETSFCYQ